MLKSVFSILSSQETGSSSVSLKMIFGALQITAIQIQDSFAVFKNPKIPGIQPRYDLVLHLSSLYRPWTPFTAPYSALEPPESLNR